MDSYIIVKRFCRINYLTGVGNFWFENDSVGDDSSFLYKIYGVILFLVYGSTTVLEIMAALFGEFPDDEKSDSVTFAVSHTVVMVKLFSVINNKQMIKALNRKMVTVCEEYQEEKLRETNYKMVKINIIAYVVTVYGCMACYVYLGFRKMFNGSHFVTVVTYYPAYEDNSVLATFFRVYFTMVLTVMLVNMIFAVDGFTMMYIIMFKYKFITLRNYLDDIREEFEEASKINIQLAAERLANGLIIGIVMHRELLNMAKDIDKIFGFVMALQVCQSFGSCVSLLLQIAISIALCILGSFSYIYIYAESRSCICSELSPYTPLPLLAYQSSEETIRFHFYASPMMLDREGDERAPAHGPKYEISDTLLFVCADARPTKWVLSDDLTIVASMKIIFFVFALFFLLGLFLCNAGEITYQASLISNSIFYCGWHACPMQRLPQQRAIRPLVLFATMQAQQPLVMKAFKMLPLNYKTFISVVRSTYSVFALLYAQNQ